MQLYAKGNSLDLSLPKIMGILNITPDSFSDGGHYLSPSTAIQHAFKMVEAGATIIDIGGESTRPYADSVSVEEELERTIPIIEQLSKVLPPHIWISIDTYKPAVMQAAIQAGACFINDINALQEPGALQVAATTGVAVCLMHMQGKPAEMQNNPVYKEVIQAVTDFFYTRIDACLAAGIKRNCITLDPGFGFGKALSHNYTLLARLKAFSHFDLPLLVGISRKSMVSNLLQTDNSAEITSGSVNCALIAALEGAKLIRVHDVKETAQAMRIVTQLILSKEKYNNDRT